MGRQAWVGWTERGRDERGRDERGRDELDVQDRRAYLRSRQERAQAGRLGRSGSTYCGRARSATVSAAIVSPSARLAPSRSSIRSSR